MSHNSTGQCNLMPKANSTSFPIAPYWENIPEQLFLNMAISLILYIIFWIFSEIGNRKQDQYQSRHDAASFGVDSANIFALLYSYRDPEKWYVLPRYEFLKPDKRHHEHEQVDGKLLVPPKLPAANPLELLSFEDSKSKSKSGEESNPIGPKLVHVDDENKNKKINSKTSLKDNNHSNNVDQLQQSNQKRKSTIKSNEKQDNLTSLAPLESGYFYPTILEDEQLKATGLTRFLNRIFSYFFRTTDADMIYAKSIDAYEYLLFQRHLILIMFLVSTLVIFIILPINWFMGDKHLESTIIGEFSTSFQRTTIKNLNPESKFFWAHIVCSATITVLTVLIIHSYKNSISSRETTELARRTLLIGNIPKDQRHREKLIAIFENYFPKCTIEALQFVYDVWELEDIQQKLEIVLVAKEFCHSYKRKYKRSLMVKQTEVNEKRFCCGMCRICSFCYLCFCWWPREESKPGEIFYEEEEQRFRAKIKKLCQDLVKKPSEYAFVTLKSHREARNMLKDLTKLKNDALNERLSRLLRLNSRSAGSSSGSQHRPGSKYLAIQPQTDGSDSDNTKPQSPSLTQSRETTPKPDEQWEPQFNPHVRSIRSPQLKKLESPINAKKSILPNQDQNQKSLVVQSGEKSPASGQIAQDQQPEVMKQINKTASSKSAADNNTNNSIESSPASSSKSLVSSTSSKNQPVLFDSKSPSTSLSKAIAHSPLAWSVRYAPHPDNIQYNDLLKYNTVSHYTLFLLHSLMVIIFIFFTTPTVVMSIIDKAVSLRPPANDTSGSPIRNVLVNYAGTLLQIIATAILPALITIISKCIPHEDTAAKSHSIMWKTYLFLVLMVIVMPSVGMSSAQAFISSEIDPNCLFPTDNGAYFINYVISTIFLSNVMELLKPVEILTYYFLLLTSRSRADFEGARQSLESEFSVSSNHTSVLLMFSVVMTYAISCPLIAPAGFVYLVLKHRVDHYHLYNTHFTKKVGGQLQTTIVIFVKSAILLMLFQTMISLSIHTGTNYFSVMSQILFWSSLALFLLNCFYNCTNRKPITKINKKRLKPREFCACFYLPLTLDKLLRDNAIPEECLSRKINSA